MKFRSEGHSKEAECRCGRNLQLQTRCLTLKGWNWKSASEKCAFWLPLINCFMYKVLLHTEYTHYDIPVNIIYVHLKIYWCLSLGNNFCIPRTAGFFRVKPRQVSLQGADSNWHATEKFQMVNPKRHCLQQGIPLKLFNLWKSDSMTWHSRAGKSHFTEVVSSRFRFVESIESIAFTQAPSSTFGLGHLILTSYRTKTKGFHRLFKFQAVKHFMFFPFRTGQVFSIYCTFLDPWSIWSFDRIFKFLVLLWMVLRFVVLVLFFWVLFESYIKWNSCEGNRTEAKGWCGIILIFFRWVDSWHRMVKWKR